MKLKEWRTANNVSRSQLAQLAGVSYHTLASYESGRRRPSTATAKRLEQITSGAVQATDLLGLTSLRSVAESATEFTPEEPQNPQTVEKIRAERMDRQPVTVGVPRDLLELSRKYGLDVEALLAEGGLPRLREVFKQAYMEHNRKGIEWAREYVQTYGTPSEQLGMI